MRLLKYKVTNFRSVKDSGWIESGNVTALVGANESGKTNLLLPLWKLKPSQAGEIKPFEDYPREIFSQIEESPEKYVFIEAIFSPDGEEIGMLRSYGLANNISYKEITVRKFFNDKYQISFNSTHPLREKINFYYKKGEMKGNGREELFIGLIIDLIPRFIYYSDFGILDGNIDLKKVAKEIRDISLINQTSKRAAQLRTLEALFKYAQLNMKEILEESEENDSNISIKKRKRYTFFDRLSTKITEDFQRWWQQEKYTFDFSIDGDDLILYISDEKRPWKVEFENRSAGLKWFISFFLNLAVTLEKKSKYNIILLDEPGLTLHPLGQKDLVEFLKNFSDTSQVLYTSHSPFMIDADRLDQVRKVYCDAEGYTVATSDLREGSVTEKGASYAVYSALNLSVSESLLIGCQPVLVEGASDQFYLTAIKFFLIENGFIHSGRELVFPPCGGAKTIRPVVSLLLGRDGTPPYVILDGDSKGEAAYKSLKGSSNYKDYEARLLCLKQILPELENPEVEDLFPTDLLLQEFGEIIAPHSPKRMEGPLEERTSIVMQIEQWAERESIILPQYWKVTLAKRVKDVIFSKSPYEFKEKTVEIWKRIFSNFSA